MIKPTEVEGKSAVADRDTVMDSCKLPPLDDAERKRAVWSTEVCAEIRVEVHVILSLCCGRRRAGDVSGLFSKLRHIGSANIVVINIDIVSKNPLHDLSIRSNFDSLLRLIFGRRVHGVIIAPPRARLGLNCVHCSLNVSAMPRRYSAPRSTF